MIDLAPIEAALRETRKFRKLGRINEFAELSDTINLADTPAAYVMLAGYRPGGDASTSATISQRIDLTVSVFCCVGSVRSDVLLRSTEEAEALVRGLLFGYRLPDTEAALLIGAYRIRKIAAASVVITEQEFTTRTTVRIRRS